MPQENFSEYWPRLRQEAEQAARAEPAMRALFHDHILAHQTLPDGLAHFLDRKLTGPGVAPDTIKAAVQDAFRATPTLEQTLLHDLNAVTMRDPACQTLLQPFLFFKGFAALQAHRTAHWLWNQDRAVLAYYIQSRCSELFQVDIHPAARLGHGLFLDHATDIVIGETSVIGNNVSILQGVTLGGNGKDRGDRHPKIKDGVLIGAGAKVLGNITIGEEVLIAAGSVVLKNVPPHVTVAGVPAKPLRGTAPVHPAERMTHDIQV
ncbi:MAG: serine O-acetyltransferase [Alphaproteobacteria bacterium]